jgi:acyl-CoA reductase-like NAD-dependent aldehyde dehydrogenase
MSAITPEPPAAAYARLRAADERAGGLSLDERDALLLALDRRLVARADAFVAALDADFGGRSAEETLLAEVLSVANAARHARRNLRSWARPRRVGVDLPFWPTRAQIVPQPLGVVGVLSPWNYPVHLSLSPIVGALAAGNRVALKPPELTPRTAAELAGLLDEALGPDVAQTVPGGPEVAAAFARLPFDHLLFTGSGERGREVMRAAAENLTPVTLELGGKCPAVILPDADLDRAARALVLGKALNAGQTCVAPDTVLLAGVEVGPVRDALRRAYAELYPDGRLPTALISDRHRSRVEALAAGTALEPLGPGPAALSLAVEPGPDSPLLREEVFGPVLPLRRVGDLAAATAWIRARPAPLAVYLFTRDRRAEAEVLASTRAGALVVNGTVVQAAIEALPFGGVGASGFGRYHGRAGFDTFSNLRAHVRAAPFNLARLCDPPYGERKRRLIGRLLRG